MTVFTRVTPAVAVVAIASALGACSSPTTSPTTARSTLSTTSTTSTVAPAPTVSQNAVRELCDHIKGSLPDWRIQTPSLTRPALNVIVQTWGFEHGMTTDLIRNRKLVDDLTTAECADVRTEALQALDLPDFASGLIGLG